MINPSNNYFVSVIPLYSYTFGYKNKAIILYKISKRFYPGGVGGKEFGHVAKILANASVNATLMASTTTTQQITPSSSQLHVEPGIRQVLESHPCRTLMVSSQNTALVLFKEKCTSLVPYVPSIAKTIAITQIPPNTIMPTGPIITDQRAAFALVNVNGEKMTSEQFLGQVSTEMNNNSKPPLFTSTAKVLGIIPENVCTQVVNLGSDNQDSEINTKQRSSETALINKNSSKQDIAQELEQFFKQNRKESDKILLNNYKKIMLSFSTMEKELERADNIEMVYKILTELLSKACMQEALYLATKLSLGIIMTNEHKNVCKAFLSLQKHLDDLYKKHIIDKNIISDNVKFIQKKIDAIVDPEFKILCQRLFNKKHWVNFEELAQDSALSLDIKNQLENKKICTKNLLTFGIISGVIRVEKNQPILDKDSYKNMSLAPEKYNLNFIDKELNISNIIQQFVDQDFLVGKLKKNPDTIINLADNTHHMIFTPLYHKGSVAVEKYLSFVYFTSTANNLKVSNDQIFMEEGSKKAQYISIWNVGRIISKELVAETQQTPDAIQALEYTKAYSPIIIKYLEDNKDNLDTKKVQEPLIMTAENFQKLLQEIFSEQYEAGIIKYIDLQQTSDDALTKLLEKREALEKRRLEGMKNAVISQFISKEIKVILKEIKGLTYVLEKNETQEKKQLTKKISKGKNT